MEVEGEDDLADYVEVLEGLVDGMGGVGLLGGRGVVLGKEACRVGKRMKNGQHWSVCVLKT